MLRKSSHMHLINDQILHCMAGLEVFSPVKIIHHNACSVSVLLIRIFPPAALSCHSPCIGIQKRLCLVKKQSFLRYIRAIQSVGILEFRDFQTKHDHGINLPDPVAVRERKNGIRLCLPSVIKKQFTGSCILRMNRKIHSIGQCRGSIDFVDTRPHLKVSYPVYGYHLFFFQCYKSEICFPHSTSFIAF